MNDESERATRAGIYVLGLMDERERARAERDLEIDAAFREAVAALADRMRAEAGSRAARDAAPVSWGDVASRLSSLPQMRNLPEPAAPPALDPALPVRFGRRRGDLPRAPVGRGRLPAMPAITGARAGLLVLGLLLAFAVGYAAGMHAALNGARAPAAGVAADPG